jgi:hypothetical protein
MREPEASGEPGNLQLALTKDCQQVKGAYQFYRAIDYGIDTAQ